ESFPARRASSRYSMQQEVSCDLDSQICALSRDELKAALLCNIEHGVELIASEETVFTGALNFHEVAGFLHHDILLDFFVGVFLIWQVQADIAFDNAYGDCSDGVYQWLAGNHALVFEDSDGIGKRNIGTRNRCSTGTTIGLEHIAVNLDGVLPQLAQVNRRAQ